MFMRTMCLAAFAAIVGCGGQDTSTCSLAFSNEDSPIKDIVINEVMAKSADGSPDWIELKNVTGSEADLGCWSIVDKSSKHQPYVLAPNTRLEAGGYLVLVRDKTGATSFDWGFGDGDSALLRDSAGRIADSTNWKAGQAQAGGAWGRSPDGTGDFASIQPATQGATNATAPSAGGAVQ